MTGSLAGARQNREEGYMARREKDVKSESIFSRQLTRRSVLKAGLVGAAGFGVAPILEACSTSPSSSGSTNKIVIGTFQDHAMVPFRDLFPNRVQAEKPTKAHSH